MYVHMQVLLNHYKHVGNSCNMGKVWLSDTYRGLQAQGLRVYTYIGQTMGVYVATNTYFLVKP